MNQLGRDYEKLLNKDIRKSMGKFYTPDYIIDYILSLTLKNEDIIKNPFLKILDPSCGAGFFLIKAYEMLREKFESGIEELNSIYAEETYCILSENSKKYIKGREYWVKERINYHILKNCIYGADLDGEALKIAGKVLEDKEGFAAESLNLIKCDSLIKWENVSFNEYQYFSGSTSREGYIRLKEFWENEFDFIIGNPPFVMLLKSEIDRPYFEYLEKNYNTLGYKRNTFYILIERCIQKLKNKGIHSFVVPDRYFSSKSYMLSRKELLNKTKVINVTCFSGRVFKDAIVGTGCYVLKKETPLKGHSFDLNLNFESKTSFDNSKMLQEEVSGQKEYVLNILTMEKNDFIISKVYSQGDMLGDYCEVHVGMMIKDKHSQFNKDKESEKRKRIIIGRDLKEYYILNKERYFVPEEAEIFGGTKSSLKHERNPKLLLRKTGDKIVAAPDFQGVYSEQSVYMVIPRDSSKVYNLLGQLQCRLCNYIYRNLLISNPGRYPYIQHYDALKLPVNPRVLKDENFDELIKNMISLKENNPGDESGTKECELQREIDSFIYKAYGFDSLEIDIIENY